MFKHFHIDSKSDVNYLIEAIRLVESNGNDNAINIKEQARGPLQIRPILLSDINSFQSYQYSIEDCFNFEKSVEMFHIFAKKYTPDYDLEKLARNWNGGPQGYLKLSTVKYWKKVEKYYNILKNN